MPSESPQRSQIILVVDDEPDLVELVAMNLERHGFAALKAANGAAALEAARTRKPDLVVLDLMLPGIDGIEVARRLRADPSTAHIPIIMLTARGEETDELVGLAIGADDYVTKPFSTRVLVARVKALLRRSPQSRAGEEPVILAAGPLRMDTAKHEVDVEGQPVRLTLTEFKLLRALVEGRGRVLSRDRLMDKAMGTGVFVTDRAIDVHVTAIRRKLGEAAWLVRTVRGVGYRIQEDRDEE